MQKSKIPRPIATQSAGLGKNQNDSVKFKNNFGILGLSFCILIFAFSIFNTADAAVLSRPTNNLGLVGYWPMNEGTSTIAGDFSGKGNNGTLTGMASPPTATSGWTNQGKPR